MSEQQWYADMGAALRKARKARGWTIYDVAALLGTSHVAVSYWERGLRRMHAYRYAQLREQGLLR